MSPEQAGAALRSFAGSLEKTVSASLDDAGERAERRAVQDFRNKTPGRSIFAAKKQASTPRLLIETRTLRTSQGAVSVELILKGMAALIEEGGRTKPPRRGVIFPVSSKALRFQGPGGVIFATKSKHRGSRVPKQQIGQRAVEDVARGLPAAIDQSISNAVRVSGLG